MPKIKLYTPDPPLTFDIPAAYTISTPDVDLADIHIKEIPKIALQSNSKLDASTVSVIRITEIPDIRAHMPVNMNFGFKILGFEVMSLSVCGESQLITEKYVPNARERCEKDPCDPC